MTKLYDTKDEDEKLIIIGIDDESIDINDTLDELEELVDTAGASVIGRMIQKRESIHKGHYFGKGKMEELKAYAEEILATGIVCDDELSPSQIRNMSTILDMKVMTRTLVILDIFAKRATTAEGKVQVELAQLKYQVTHLTGSYKYLSRQGGGIGSKGPGEKKLETDRRNIQNRIDELNKEIKNIEKHRSIIRENRVKNKSPIIALVGYTNAGKSTTLNTITNADVVTMDKLFATLDTTTRKIKLESKREYLFTDTVGFINKLSHNLIKAFRATLEEIKYSDILLHIVDSSSSMRDLQIKTVYKTLKELDCMDKPIITVYNKIDKEDVVMPLPVDEFSEFAVKISAKNNIGINNLLEKIEELVKSFEKTINIKIPYSDGNIISMVHLKCEIISQENKEDGVYFEVFADEEMQNRLINFII